MRTASRAISVGLCLGASIPLAAAPAIASGSGSTTLTSKALAATWFWNKAVNPPAALPGALPGATLPSGTPSGIPANDLAVGFNGDPSGNPDKETYLAFDLHTLGANAVLDSFTFSFAIDAGNPTNVQSGDVPLEACLPTRIWVSAPDGGNWADKPADDCSAPALATYDAAKKVYTFDVTSIMQSSIGGQNFGVAIREPASYTSPFQLAFTESPMITAKVTYHQPAPVAPSSVATGPVAAPPSVTAPVTSGGAITGTSGAALGAVLSAQPEIATPPTNPAPLIGHELTPATALAPFGGDTRLGRNFWLASLLGALGVLAVGLVLSQRPKVALVNSTSTRLSRVLSARAAALASGTPAAGRGSAQL